MKICVAQTKPVKGDIETNIIAHKKLIAAAVKHNAGIIIFPELSLTGYEPALAKQLAITKNDISNTSNIVIGVGAPTKTEAGNCITMILFQPGKERITYSKKYLHADEEPFFVSGQNFAVLPVNGNNIGLAICYELSVNGHSQNAFNNGATVYIASVAKSATGVENASLTLAQIAQHYSAPVLMSNSVGQSDDFIGAGASAVWNNKGGLLAQLNAGEEGVLIFDTVTGEIITENGIF